MNQLHADKNPVDHESRMATLQLKHVLADAGAGSGKTESATQRFLLLLSIVSKPEAILKITFTNKAAAELRSRIISALQLAQSATPPSSPHERLTWELGRKALKRDSDEDWGILSNPNRLNIQTIDSFCAQVTKHLPVTSQFGSQPDIADDADELYREAAVSTLALIDEDDNEFQTESDAVRNLLFHLDNNFERVINLFITMLSTRDQWISLVQNAKQTDSCKLKTSLEENLKYASDQVIKSLSEDVTTYEHDLITLTTYATSNIKSEDHVLAPLKGVKSVTELCDSVTAWKGIRHLFMTKDGKPRSKVDKNIGFPAPSSLKGEEKAVAMKMKLLFTELQQTLFSHKNFFDGLLRVEKLPSESYTDEQWSILSSLFNILPMLISQLHWVFSNHGSVDYIEISKAAISALGGDGFYSESAARFISSIEHILVDEYQDTNKIQNKLIELLTQNWKKGDGRTLYLVGDPMQSIYRFRQSDVSLFLSAKHHGVGALKLNPVNLSVNFRSTAEHVKDVNEIFSQVFPSLDDISAGAVSYKKSDPHSNTDHNSGISFTAFKNADDRVSEAIHVAKTISHIRKTSPDDSVAILVRNKNHLSEIVNELKKTNVKYQAIDIDALTNRQAIKDLMSLTKALLNPSDKMAWLALLRSPMLGLTKDDLETVSQYDENKTTCFHSLCACFAKKSFKNISMDNVNSFITTINNAFENRLRKNVRHWVEGVWISLGGPSAVSSADLENTKAYFRLLDEVSQDSETVSISKLEKAIEKLYAAPDKSQNSEKVQLMSIHKSKGLQFDHVFIPGLDRVSKNEDSKLLLWHSFSDTDGNERLLMAPISKAGGEKDSIYEYIRSEESKRGKLELARLLYVACTRARKNTYLLANIVTTDDGDIVKPDSRSLLSHIYNSISDRAVIVENEVHDTDGRSESKATNNQEIKRLAPNWKKPELPHGNLLEKFRGIIHPPRDNQPNHDWSPAYAQIVGTVVHRTLRQIAKEGLDNWNTKRINMQAQSWKKQLSQFGLTSFMLNTGVDHVERHVTTMINSKFFRKLVVNESVEPELAITHFSDGKINHYALDVTFLSEDGTRWIVDYKTDSCGNELSPSEFHDQAANEHSQQLRDYAEAFYNIDHVTPRTALLMTSDDSLIEINPDV